MSLNETYPADLIDPASSSLATHCPLRRGDRISALHPLKQNPPSLLDPAELSTFDDVDIDATTTSPVRPPPSALTAAPTHYDPQSRALRPSPGPIQDYPSSPGRPSAGAPASASSQRHQRSLTSTTTSSFFNNWASTIQEHTSRTALHSPSKSLASFIPSRASVVSANALASWFNGSSAPVKVGFATREDESESGEEFNSDSEDDESDDEPTMTGSIFKRATTTLTGASPAPAAPAGPDTTPKQTRTAAPTPTRTHTQASASGSRFSWLLSTPTKKPLPSPSASPKTKSKKQQIRHNPYSEADDELIHLNITQSLFPHGPADPYNPTSFNDLLTAAESLLTRYQTSYRHLSAALSDARAEQDAQADELDESETRARHLKAQLDALGTRAADQDRAMKRMADELAAERRARMEAETGRMRAETIIRTAGLAGDRDGENANPRTRKSRGSRSDISVDSGFDSEFEAGSEAPLSSAASVFSHNSSVTTPFSDPSDSDITLVPGPREHHLRPLEVRTGNAQTGWGCKNCEGGVQSAVWAKLAQEKAETAVLRQRVEALEAAVDGALGVVGGVGI